jgi:hypothetical protein
MFQMPPTNPTTGSTLIENPLFQGRGELSSDLLGKLMISATAPVAVRSLLKKNWDLTNDETPALTAVIEHEHATGAITGSHWVLSGDIKKNMGILAGRIWQDANQDYRVRFDIPRLEEFPFSNSRPARNVSDWVDLKKMKNITLEHKTNKTTHETWEDMKKVLPEIENKGLSVRLTICMADVGKAGMYVNIAPFGVTKLAEECLKLKRDVNDPALPTWGIKSTATGGTALMAYPVNYCPIETAELGVGVAHLPLLESLGPEEEPRNFPTSEEIRTETAAFHRMASETARIATREVTEERFQMEWGQIKPSEFEWPAYEKIPSTATPPTPRATGKIIFLFFALLSPA